LGANVLYQPRVKVTFAVGHLALGYITGIVSSKPLKANLNVPLILTLPLLPDIDLLFEPTLQHGGPTHSIILIFMIFLPAFAVWNKRAVPYFLALVSHPIVDYLTRTSRSSGIQLFFPLTSNWYAAGSKTAMPTYIYTEILLFSTLLTLMIVTKELAILFKPHKSNLLVAIPIATALLPVFLRFPIEVPTELVIPHIILIFLLAGSILVDVKHLIRHHHL